jgi:transposase-like protein
MPRPCSVCEHPDRQAIEQALATQEPYRRIATRYGTSPAALYRHQAHAQRPAHTGPLGEQSSDAAPDPRAAALLATAQRLHTTADHLFRRTLDVRSTYDARVLQHEEELAHLHVEVTGLLTELLAQLTALTAAAGPSGR